MTTINLVKFSGISPRTISARLEDSHAEIAHNVNLRHGTLKPWRTPKLEFDVSENTKTIFQWGCCWYEWDKCVEATEYSQECPRLYVTGDAPYPTFTPLGVDCSIGCGDLPWTRLGLPRPKKPPVTFGGEASGNGREDEGTAYIYTYVNCHGEEGAPSPPSLDLIREDDGSPILISGFVIPPPEYNVKRIWIYRLVSGRMVVQDQVKDFQTEYYYVGEIDINTLTFTDSVRNLDVGHAMNTMYAHEPHANLRGMMLVNNSNTLAGFVENRMYFSDNNGPWKWSDYNEVSLDDTIRMIRPLGPDIAVMTDAHTYIVQGMADCKGTNVARTVSKSEYPFPAIECCSNFSSVETPMGVVYVTSRGLALIAERNPTPTIVTEPWYAEDDWRKLQPENMRLGYYDGAVFCTSETVSFILHLDAVTYRNENQSSYMLTTISDKPEQYYRGRNGEMFFLEGGFIKRWNAGSAYRPFVWQSKMFDTRSFTNFKALQINSAGITEFSLLVNGKVVYNKAMLDEKNYRLPFYNRKVRHNISLTGVDEVWGVQMATTFMELGSLGN